MADQSDRNCVVPALHRMRRDALKIHQGPAMLATGMKAGMEASYVRLEGMI
jgi:hypothetical protein